DCLRAVSRAGPAIRGNRRSAQAARWHRQDLAASSPAGSARSVAQPRHGRWRDSARRERPGSDETMICERCDQLLQDLLGGAGPGAALLEHLAGCVSCRELYESGITLARGVRALRRPQPPEGLTDRIVAAVRLDRKRRQGRRLTWARVAVVAAAILLALLVT